MNLSKENLRKEYLHKRSLISANHRHSASKIINQKLIKNINWDSIKFIYLYKPINNEVALNELEKFIETKPNIKVRYAENKLSTSQDIPLINDIDLIILPVVCFDNKLNRIGYGGGYYDKFLAKNYCKQIVGAAYSLSEVEQIPVEPHDIQLQKVITEKDIFSI